MLNRGLILVLVAAAAIGLLIYSRFTTEPRKVSGFVEAYEIRIGSRVGGRVQEVSVDEGSVVKQGDALVTLQPFDLVEQRTRAQAELAARTADFERLTKGYRAEEIGQAEAERDRLAAQLSELENGPRKQEIAAAEARGRLAEAELQLAQQQLDRMQRVIARNAGTQEDLDQATTKLRVAQATLDVRQQELAQLNEGARPEEILAAKAQLEQARQAWMLRRSGYRQEEITQAKATVESAEAELHAIERQISELKIAAPLDAVVEAIDLRPGDLVSPNAPILSLMDTSRLWVRAYVPENHLDLTIGQEIWVTADSFPGQRFRGHISFISRQAEFTPSNVQTPEERSKQVFRIRVTLDEGRDQLRPGMSADVWLDTAAAPKGDK